MPTHREYVSGESMVDTAYISSAIFPDRFLSPPRSLPTYPRDRKTRGVLYQHLILLAHHKTADMARVFDVDVGDPFAQITAPPADETPEQRRIRERREGEERRISEEIDEALKAEREEIRAKRKNRLKVLLLGQSESGTSKHHRSFDGRADVEATSTVHTHQFQISLDGIFPDVHRPTVHIPSLAL